MNKPDMRTVAIAAGCVVGGLVLGWALRSTTAHNEFATLANYEDWRVACPPQEQKAGLCELVQDVIDPSNRSAIARITLVRASGKRTMEIDMPFDTLLEQGIGLTFDKEPVRVFPFRTCTNIGCVVVIDMDDKLIASLRTAKEARVVFVAPDGRALAAAYSLRGYQDAESSLLSSQSRRESWFRRLWS